MFDFRDGKKPESYPLRYNEDFFSSRKFEEQLKIRFRSREGFCLASLGVINGPGGHKGEHEAQPKVTLRLYSTGMYAPLAKPLTSSMAQASLSRALREISQASPLRRMRPRKESEFAVTVDAATKDARPGRQASKQT
jgi:hypothetical protein